MTAPEQAAQVSVVTIDQSTIYNLLLEVRDDVRDVKRDVSEIRKDTEDHEQRIRALEARVWKWAGAATVLGAGGGFGLAQFFGGA